MRLSHCTFYIFLIFLTACQLGKVGEVDTGEDDSTSNNTPPSENPSSGETTEDLAIFDYSVNKARINWNIETQTLTLTSDGGSNVKGGFQGGGQGNKPIAGLKGYHNTELRDFKVDFTFQGSVTPWMNFLIDTDNDEVADYIFVPIMNIAGNKD